MIKSLLLLAVIAVAGCRGPEDNCLDDEGAKIEAFVMSQHFVRDALLSPTSASFPNYTSDGVGVLFVSACHFRVIAYVDAQNGFGATARQMYSIDMEANPKDGSWRGTGLGLF